MSSHTVETITVKVARLGGAVREVLLSRGSTVHQALDAAEEDVTSEKVYFNGAIVEQSTPLNSSGVLSIMTVPSVKGA